MSLAEMCATLREMRKDLVKPVSRMRKGDISHEIEALRQRRETTPAPAATPSAPPKGMKPDVENIKDVKKSVFMKPKDMPTGMSKASAKKPADHKAVKGEKMSGEAKAKTSKKDMLMKMLAELDD
jgi:hypothetical protein